MQDNQAWAKLSPKAKQKAYEACRARVGAGHRIATNELIAAHMELKGAA